VDAQISADHILKTDEIVFERREGAAEKNALSGQENLYLGQWIPYHLPIPTLPIALDL
jgi:hypothetical protein